MSFPVDTLKPHLGCAIIREIGVRLKIQYQTLYGRNRNEEFRVQHILGVGGFSLIYEVLNNKGISFAAKIVKSGNATEVSSIKHEASILSQVQGDNVIGLLYFHDGTVYDLPPYLILEHAEGSLNDIILRRCACCNHFTMTDLLNMFLQICRGMRLINQTVVHCDLNPKNILLIGDTLKIADFGVAEPLGQPAGKSEFSKHRHWEYVAPEYWEGGDDTPEMDIYCAGLIFYFAAALKYPYVFQRESDTNSESPFSLRRQGAASACKEAHTFQVAKNPLHWNAQISPNLSGLILKMIAKKPEDRFHSWDEIITILNQCAVENQTESQRTQVP